MKPFIQRLTLCLFTLCLYSTVFSQSTYNEDVDGLIYGETCVPTAPSTQTYTINIPPNPYNYTLNRIDWFYYGTGHITLPNTSIADQATLSYESFDGGTIKVVMHYTSDDPNATYLYYTFTGYLTISSPRFDLWYPYIKTQTGRNVYTYQEVPDPLVEYGLANPPPAPATSPCAALSWQWQSSSTPTEGGFTDIPGATGTSYTFTAPLSQTTYFRRKLSTQSGLYDPVYSNTLKLEVASLYWEDRNYTRVHEILVSGITDWQTVDQLPIGKKLVATSYFDGLGRTTEAIAKQTATPAASSDPWGDVVNLTTYNGLGLSTQFLPYSTTTESGNYKTTAGTELATYYTTNYNAINPYTQFDYDNSPLNRVVNVYKPGEAWWLNTPTKFEYDINTTDENVQQLTVDFAAGSIPDKFTPYTANQLLRNVTIDENDKKVITYTNTLGQVVLKKVQIDGSPSAAHAGWICTYNVYDYFGRLRYQLQPEAVKYFDDHSWDFTTTTAQQVLKDLCFKYEYDAKGRTTLKKAPGAEELHMLYDDRNRLVLTQDGNQAAKQPLPEWTATLYDDLDRPVITTLYRTSKTIAQLQTAINNAATTTTVTNGFSQPITNLVIDQHTAGTSLYQATNNIEAVPGFETPANATGDIVLEITRQLPKVILLRWLPIATSLPKRNWATVPFVPFSSTSITTIIAFLILSHLIRITRTAWLTTQSAMRIYSLWPQQSGQRTCLPGIR